MRAAPVIPVLVLEEVKPTGRSWPMAFVDAGLPVLEITLRTPWRDRCDS